MNSFAEESQCQVAANTSMLALKRASHSAESPKSHANLTPSSVLLQQAIVPSAHKARIGKSIQHHFHTVSSGMNILFH